MMEILLYTSDRLLVDLLRISLEPLYRVCWVKTERRLFTALLPARVGAIVLDAVPGDMADMCRRLRAFSGAPLIAIACGDMVDERVLLLRAGADEALGRSFKLPELVARLHAKLRRAEFEQRRARLPVVERRALC